MDTNNEGNEGLSTDIQSGAIPLKESGLPLGIPIQPDIMASYHEHASLKAMTMSALLGQHKLIGTYTISTATDPTKPIWSFRHTPAAVASMHLRSMVKLFRLSSWTLHFKFEFRSNFQQVGQCLVVQHNIPLQVSWYLLGKDITRNDETQLYTNYKLMTLLPHTKVAMGEDVDVNATMKWNIPVEGVQSHPTLYAWKTSSTLASPNEDYDMGSIFVIAPWKMDVAQGVTPEMTVRIWSWLTDVKLASYDPEDTIL